MPWKVWTRETLSAAQMQSYLQDQVVTQWASVAARDAAIPVGSRKAGMLAWTDAEATWWGIDVAGGAWRVVARPDQGYFACTVNGGWGAVAGHAVKVRRVGNARAALTGWFTNGGAYTANGTQTPIALPAGFAPKVDQVVRVILAGGGWCTGTLTPGGVLRLDYGNVSPFGASTQHFLDSVTYDITDTGS